MKQRGKWSRLVLFLFVVPGLMMASASGGEAAVPPLTPAPGPSPTVTDVVEGSKAPTSAIARTDPSLLNSDSSAPVEVMVKLDYDAVATYSGSIAGLAATSPSVTGRDLTGSSAAEVAYRSHIVAVEDTFRAGLTRVPGARVVGDPLRIVYGGVRAVVPANRIGDLLKIDGVVAVHRDTLRQPLTDSSPDFIGADAVYPALGGSPEAGSGVIFGVLDSGAWPEHPSLADLGNLDAPPAKADGTPRVCDFGENPLTAAADPFTCNNKLISGEPFLDTYLSSPARAAAERYHTARDSDGHGTHTGTTTAGNNVGSAVVYGVDRGPIHGIAPGAWVAVYKVCGMEGCFGSDSAAAVGQAILDGVDVINFSISGGTNPAVDPVELAFLDAYAAGVFVSASGGNEGPDAGTVNHQAPWTTTVAASTQTREFQSALTLTASDGATTTLQGVSLTGGVAPALPVVLASAAPYGSVNCTVPAPPGTFTGKIVACQRGGNGRVAKGFNVAQGGAAGMILYNPTLADVETDNHWLPAIHLADGADFRAFMAAHGGVVASFTAGAPGTGQGDVMAAFSSRGPGGLFIKPDVTAPGVQILAGHTPDPDTIDVGPPGNLFQAIAGTSMSSPHVAGAAVLLQDLHPEWTPGQIKSALMTTATTDVVKEDQATKADPFDLGSGRIDLTVAGNPGLTFDAPAAQMIDVGLDPLAAPQLNVPSINVPVLAGEIKVTRTATNVSGRRVRYDISTKAPALSSIKVIQTSLDLLPGRSVRLDITIKSRAATAQYFGEIKLTPRTPGLPTLHIPVAFVPQQGEVALSSTCAAASVKLQRTTNCTVTATNTTSIDTTVDLTTKGDQQVQVTGATGATVKGAKATLTGAALVGRRAGVPSVTTGGLFGYLPLDTFGIDPVPVGDEQIVNFNVPGFVYGGTTYSRIGIDSNGYIVVGGGSIEDNSFDALLPDPSRPNNILAPFWSDLDGSDAPGIYVGILSDGVSDWIVVEWRVNVFGTNSLRVFQTWIGVNGTEDISYAYDPANLPADPDGIPFAVGAENVDGGGQAIDGLPTGDLTVTSSPSSPGGTASYNRPGAGYGHRSGQGHDRDGVAGRGRYHRGGHPGAGRSLVTCRRAGRSPARRPRR